MKSGKTEGLPPCLAGGNGQAVCVVAGQGVQWGVVDYGQD